MSIIKGIEKISLAAVDTVLLPVDAVRDTVTQTTGEDSAARRRARRIIRRTAGGLKEIYDNEEILPKTKPTRDDLLQDTRDRFQ